MRSLSLPIFAVLGISLFSYDSSDYFKFIPFSVGLSDIAVLILLFYSLFKYRSIEISSIPLATSLLALILLISGIYNYLSFPFFNLQNFSFNYLRVTGIVAMVLLLPPLFNELGKDKMTKAMVWVIRFHCLAILLDSFGYIPVEFKIGNDTNRPVGFFYEPGWFGVWIGLAIFYVLQVSRNYSYQYFRVFDIIFFSSAIIISTGIRGLIFLVVAWIIMIFNMRWKTRVSLGLSVLIFIVFLFLGGDKLLPKYSDNQVGSLNAIEYMERRLPVLMPGATFKDGSVLDRIENTRVGAIFTMQNSPLLGVGLGGENWFVRLPVYKDITNLAGNEAGSSGSSAMMLSVFLSGGFLSLIIYLFIGVRLLYNSSTRIIGVSLGIASLIWGGVFEVFIWFFVSLAVSLSMTEKR